MGAEESGLGRRLVRGLCGVTTELVSGAKGVVDGVGDRRGVDMLTALPFSSRYHACRPCCPPKLMACCTCARVTLTRAW